jgi:hypothetical protein
VCTFATSNHKNINCNFKLKKMKKMNLMLCMATIGAITLINNQAQAQRGHGRGGGDGNTFEVGSMTLNLGAGVGRSSFGDYGYYGAGYYGYGTGIGVKAAIERGMWQLGPGVLSLGLETGASFSSASYGGYNSSIIIAAFRSAYHFGWNVGGLDTYGGLSIGPGFRSYNYSDINTSDYTRHDIIVSPGIFVGASYFFSPNFGVNIEGGYDITEIQGGVIFKLK